MVWILCVFVILFSILYLPIMKLYYSTKKIFCIIKVWKNEACRTEKKTNIMCPTKHLPLSWTGKKIRWGSAVNMSHIVDSKPNLIF